MGDYVGLFIVKKEPKDEPSTIASVAKYRVAKSQGTRSSLRTTRCDEALGKNDLQRHPRRRQDHRQEESSSSREGSTGSVESSVIVQYSVFMRTVEAMRKLDAITEYANVERQR